MPGWFYRSLRAKARAHGMTERELLVQAVAQFAPRPARKRGMLTPAERETLHDLQSRAAREQWQAVPVATRKRHVQNALKKRLEKQAKP